MAEWTLVIWLISAHGDFAKSQIERTFPFDTSQNCMEAVTRHTIAFETARRKIVPPMPMVYREAACMLTENMGPNPTMPLWLERAELYMSGQR